MADEIVPPPKPQRRPDLVWVIFVFYLIISGSSLILQGEKALGFHPLSPARSVIEGNESRVQPFAVGFGILSIVAASSLWLLRRAALPLFSLVLLLYLCGTVWRFLPGGMYSRMMAQGTRTTMFMVSGAGIGFLIVGAVWSYTFYLWQRGVLK